MHHVKNYLGVVLFGALFAACGGVQGWEEPTAEAQGELSNCSALGDDITDHACFHAQYGPFSTVTANASQSFRTSSPNVNSAHRHYTVNLPGSSGTYEGTVKYNCTSAGDWAIYLDPDVSLLVLDSSGNTVSFELEHSVSSCSLLSEVKVVNFPTTGTYRLVFGPTSSSSVGVILEKLSDFMSYYYADGDNDGFGDTSDSVQTACVAPTGYVDDDTDCDDTRASVYPGAPELSDGLDNDCDGLVDEP